MSKKVVIPTKPVRDPAKLDQWISGEGGQAAAAPPAATPPPAPAVVSTPPPPPAPIASVVTATEEPAVEEPPPAVPMKRLTIDISENLHRRLKSTCAQRGTKMVDEIRVILESAFPE